MKSKKQLILVAAESLFAKHGYMNVSLRMIADHAGADIPILNYHFKNKQMLLVAVLKNRADEINKDRMEQLNEARKAAGNQSPGIKAILEALIYPMVKRCIYDGPEWTNYALVIAQTANLRQFAPLLLQLFDPVAEHFISAMRVALPKATEHQILWYYQFTLGALVNTLADTRRIDGLSKGSLSSSDFKTAYEHLIPFLVGGFNHLN